MTISEKTVLGADFFDRDAKLVAQQLLGKIIYSKPGDCWLTAQIIETEAYYLDDKASHASLGYTEKRKALFMPAGTIYMYFARGKDSLNISCQGAGNAVLIKSAIVYQDSTSDPRMLDTMLTLGSQARARRKIDKLCSGQTLLCSALGLKVVDWDQKDFDYERFYIADLGIRPDLIIAARRLGISPHRDPHYLYRFIDYSLASRASQNPLKARSWQADRDYRIMTHQGSLAKLNLT